MKLDRLLGIVMILLRGEKATFPSLAERFEVSRRTIGRDIDALCRAGIPVVTRQGGGGGVSIAEGYKLDKRVLTADELRDLTAAIKGLGSVYESTRVERMLDKLAPGGEAVLTMGEPIVIDLSSHSKLSLTQKIECIKQAIAEQRQIEFDYYSDKGCSARRIDPYFITFRWTDWYVFGFCQIRQDWRLFKLSRLWSLRACEDRFEPREVPPEQTDFSARLTDQHRLVAHFAPSARYQLVEAYGPGCYTEAPDGWLRLEIGYTHREFIRSWLLSFGDRARVVEPEDLADEMRAITENMANLYR